MEAAQARKTLLNRLRAEGEWDLASRLAKCGLDFRLWCKVCGAPHLAETKCNRKWCPSCAPKRANERAARLRVGIRLMRWPMHITLTVSNVEDDAAGGNFIRKLAKSFARLRRSKLWRKCVVGGVGSIEVTNKGQGWHPHIHAVIDGRWVALKCPSPHRDDDHQMLKDKFRCAAQELQAAWSVACRQTIPPRIWIRRCDAGAAAEIMKYAIKSEHVESCEGTIGPLLRMLDSQRLVMGFGSLRGLKIPKDTAHKLTCPNGHSSWTPVPPYDSLPKLTLKQKLYEQRRSAFEAKLEQILREERDRTV